MSVFKKQYGSRQPDFRRARIDRDHWAGRYISEMWVPLGKNLVNIVPSNIIGDAIPTTSAEITSQVELGRHGEGTMTGNSSGNASSGWTIASTGHPIRKNLQRWSAYAIYTAGANNGEDTRLFTKDDGVAQQSHTFMFGWTSTTAAIRARVGFGGSGANSTVSLGIGSIDFSSTSPQMTAVRGDSAGYHVNHIDSVGVHTSGESTLHAGEDITQGTKACAIGRSAVNADNYLEGGIHCIVFLDGLFLSPDQIEDLFSNPWQMFYTPTYSAFVPTAAPVGGLSIPVAYHHYSKNIRAA